MHAVLYVDVFRTKKKIRNKNMKLPVINESMEFVVVKIVELSRTVDKDVIDESFSGLLEGVFHCQVVGERESRRIVEQIRPVFSVTKSALNAVQTVAPKIVFAHLRFI
jgi:hypothetical protein